MRIPDQLGLAFTHAEAMAVGLSSSALSRSGLPRPVHGIYLNTPLIEKLHANGHEQERFRAIHAAIAQAVAPRLHHTMCFGLHTAAVLWGLPIQITPDARIAVVATNVHHRSTNPAFHTTSTTPALAQPTQLAGIRVTSPAVTWASLATQVTPHEAIALGDALIHEPRVAGTRRLTRPPLATLIEVHEAIETPWRTQRPKLRNLAKQLTTKSASRPETLLRLLLTEMGLPPEVLDYDIYAPSGAFVGCSEIAYPSVRVVFEYEGDHHRVNTAQWNRDIQKYADYELLGWHVVRVTASMLFRERDAFRAYVRQVFRTRSGGARG